jgi:hypothetical protein
MVKIARCIMLTSILLCVQGIGQQSNQAADPRGDNLFAANEFIAKGGIGIVNPNLYIDVKSAKNELRLKEGHRWTGRDAKAAEVVFFFADTIWLPQKLPEGFDISQPIVVSFETGRIRFFDFSKLSGGFYRRQAQKR